MEDYKVSVIVAAYNIQDYIVKCLESIANQTYKNLEVIVVDDGSSDNTGKLADEFAEKDNRFIGRNNCLTFFYYYFYTSSNTNQT